MPFWILVLTIIIVAIVVIIFAVRERSREMVFGAMAMIIAGAALVLLTVVFLR